jgi:hypothetical protein
MICDTHVTWLKKMVEAGKEMPTFQDEMTLPAAKRYIGFHGQIFT